MEWVQDKKSPNHRVVYTKKKVYSEDAECFKTIGFDQNDHSVEPIVQDSLKIRWVEVKE